MPRCHGHGSALGRKRLYWWGQPCRRAPRPGGRRRRRRRSRRRSRRRPSRRRSARTTPSCRTFSPSSRRCRPHSSNRRLVPTAGAPVPRPAARASRGCWRGWRQGWSPWQWRRPCCSRTGRCTATCIRAVLQPAGRWRRRRRHRRCAGRRRPAQKVTVARRAPPPGGGRSSSTSLVPPPPPSHTPTPTHPHTHAAPDRHANTHTHTPTDVQPPPPPPQPPTTTALGGLPGYPSSPADALPGRKMLAGDPISASPSPALHTAGFLACGKTPAISHESFISGTLYRSLVTHRRSWVFSGMPHNYSLRPAVSAAAVAAAAAAEDFGGCSVTIPLKVSITSAITLPLRCLVTAFH